MSGTYYVLTRPAPWSVNPSCLPLWAVSAELGLAILKLGKNPPSELLPGQDLIPTAPSAADRVKQCQRTQQLSHSCPALELQSYSSSCLQSQDSSEKDHLPAIRLAHSSPPFASDSLGARRVALEPS